MADPPPIQERSPRATLRTYLVTMILLATVPIALLMSWQIGRDVVDQQARIDRRLAATAASLARSVERELASSVDALTILSYDDTLQSGQLAAFEHEVTALPRRRPSWRSLFLVDADGRVLFDTAGAPQRPHDADLAALHRALESGRTVGKLVLVA